MIKDMIFVVIGILTVCILFLNIHLLLKEIKESK